MSQGYGAFNGRVGYQNMPPTGVKTRGTGMPTIPIDPDGNAMDDTTLDLAVAATSGITGDLALNYSCVRVAAGDIGTGNCTHTLGDGQWVGQVWEIRLDGAITSYSIVVTITNVIGGQDVFILNSVNDGLLVRWNGAAWQVLEGRTANITGSTTVAGDVLAIPVTHRYVAKTTGGDAEALTLANGTFPGQLLTISLVTAGGGTGTLTPATCTGFATVLFLGAKDTITLEYVDDTLGWMLIGAYGTDAPPVIS